MSSKNRTTFTLVLLLGLAFVFGALLVPKADATQYRKHTGDLTVEYTCLDNGSYQGTVTLTTTAVPDGVSGTTKWRVGNETFDGTPTNDTGLDRGPVDSTGNTTVMLGVFMIPGSTTGKGPWLYAWSKWTDGATKGSDGQGLDDLQGDCTPMKPPPPPPPLLETAWFHVVSYCNAVKVEGRHNVKSIEKVRHGDSFRFTAHAKKGSVFGNGKTTKVKRAHLKTTGCGHLSGS